MIVAATIAKTAASIHSLDIDFLYLLKNH